MSCFTANGALASMQWNQMLLVGAGSCLAAQKQIGCTRVGHLDWWQTCVVFRECLYSRNSNPCFAKKKKKMNAWTLTGFPWGESHKHRTIILWMARTKHKSPHRHAFTGRLWQTERSCLSWHTPWVFLRPPSSVAQATQEVSVPTLNLSSEVSRELLWKRHQLCPLRSRIL